MIELIVIKYFNWAIFRTRATSICGFECTGQKKNATFFPSPFHCVSNGILKRQTHGNYSNICYAVIIFEMGKEFQVFKIRQ